LDYRGTIKVPRKILSPNCVLAPPRRRAQATNRLRKMRMHPVIVMLGGANTALDSVRRAVFKSASMETIAGFVAPFLGWLTFV